MQKSFIRFRCPGCGSNIRTPAAAGGKRGRCPKCKTVIEIPLQEPPEAQDRKIPLDDEPQPAEERPPAERRGQDPSELLRRARELLRSKRYDELQEACEELLALPGGPPREYENEKEIGRLFASDVEFSSFSHARSILADSGKSVVWLHNFPAEAWYLRAYALIEQEDYEGAVDCLEEACALWPTNTVYCSELAFCFQKLEQPAKALELFRKTVDLCRNGPDPQMKAKIDIMLEGARQFVEQGDTDQGNQIRNSAEKLEGVLRRPFVAVEARAWRGIGFALIEQEDWEGAERAFHRSLELEPGNALALNELEYLRDRRPQQVAAEFDRQPAIRSIQESILRAYSARGPDEVAASIESAFEQGIPLHRICERGVAAGFDIAATRLPEEHMLVPETLLVLRGIEAGLERIGARIPADPRRVDLPVGIFGVEGDIHGLPLQVLELVFREAGFPVIHLGLNAAAGQVVSACRERGIRILLGSATLDTAVDGLGAVAQTLRDERLQHRVFYIIGGRKVVPQLAEVVGAGAYAATPGEALRIVERTWNSPEPAPGPADAAGPAAEPEAAPPSHPNPNRMGIMMNVLMSIIAGLEADAVLQGIFGTPVSDALVVVADANDLRIEAGGHAPLTEEQGREFRTILGQVIAAHTQR